MKSFNKMMGGIVIIFALLLVAANIYIQTEAQGNNRNYRVEIERLAKRIEDAGLLGVNLQECEYVRQIFQLEEDLPAFVEGGNSDYAIRNINGTYYRFDYQTSLSEGYRQLRIMVNAVLVASLLLVLAILFYIRNVILKPFHRLQEIPYELSKGNLTMGIKENRNRFFGKFVWGMDLLREHLEQQKDRELSEQKEKRTLVLSLSHDIKTPLSAIKLYAQALSKNLYDSTQKQQEIAVGINRKADEIESLVTDIIKASREDFLNIEVEDGEFYLNELINSISEYYTDKLSLLKTHFEVGRYDNCLLKGDIDRANEVVQNVMENAVKYGDGEAVLLAIEREEDCCLITLSNSGNTLEESELPHIFDSFWRGSNVGSNRGNGLGLYICRQLMRKMDGDIFAACVKGEMKVTMVFRMI